MTEGLHQPEDGRPADARVDAAFPNRSTPNPAAPPPRPPASGGYSRFVSLTKVVLPALALVIVTMVAVWPQLEKAAESGFSIPFATLSGGVADKQRMVNARYQGVDDDDQPYTITADVAEEAEPGSTDVLLDNPKADIALKDGAWIMMGANTGSFSQTDNVLFLTGQVSVFHDGGYELHTPSVTVDLANRTAESFEPVTGQGPFGELEGEGMRIGQDGKTVLLTGKSRVLIKPQAAQDQQQPGVASR